MSLKLQIYLLKKLLKTQKKWKELETIIKVRCISVSLDLMKVADFQSKNADSTRTQKVCHVIYNFFGSSLSKV